MRKELLRLPSSAIRARITGKDFKMALGIFLLVFLSTFPVTIPFIFIHNVRLALRISNLIAIILLFIGGWLLGRYGGFNKMRTGLAIALIGIIMVFLTIQLGG
jgi:VIT1/CCC1 family predicted Fe2+/Mn2+ transporter